MRRIKEVLRLKCVLGLGQRQIARSCSIGQSTVTTPCGGRKSQGVFRAMAAERSELNGDDDSKLMPITIPK